jgi:hypothetical protein
MPLSTKPIKSGTAEQEQKGVIIPSNAAKTLPAISKRFVKIFLIFSGGRNERMNETAKMITKSKIAIFMLSKTKKFIASPKTEAFARPKREKLNQSEKILTG